MFTSVITGKDLGLVIKAGAINEVETIDVYLTSGEAGDLLDYKIGRFNRQDLEALADNGTL